ncbi:MAG TPA: NAD(P)H-dependent glycerol-3-phosphate dehydrogenase [Thermomicrobiales bacterium]|nr:NAD(P)H-dependent glycerol-3-phosphate dehydrogenase [Thermomicrobiales bacterium]
MSIAAAVSTGSLTRVHVVGGGAWGTTLAILASRTAPDVVLVVRDADTASFLATHRRHPRSRPEMAIPGAIRFEHLGDHTIAGSEAVVLAIPVQAMRQVLSGIASALSGKPLLSAGKGIEMATLQRPSEIIRSVVGESNALAVLSGPNLSSEIAAGQPASTVVASENVSVAKSLSTIVHSDVFRTYLSTDVAGVEFGGALKNIIAIGAGIADGLGAGDNAKAALVTRGLAEIARLGVAFGADPLTFAGLSGMGDLIATCASPLSRNHQVGFRLAMGETVDEILATMTGTAEGIATTRAAVDLAARAGVEMPIASQMHRVLFGRVPPGDAIAELMRREQGPE